MKPNWELVGHADVDSGQIAIVDPCYVMSDKAYDKLTDTEMKDEVRILHKESAQGIVVGSGYGDGTYPVYMRRNSEGRVIEAKIVFIIDEQLSSEG